VTRRSSAAPLRKTAAATARVTKRSSQAAAKVTTKAKSGGKRKAGVPARRPKPPVSTQVAASLPPVAVVLASDDQRIRRLLIRRDPRLASVIKRVGRCRLPDSRTHHPFVSLVRALTSQQLSLKAAATIFGRVVDLVGGPEGLTPANLLALEASKLRAAGLSGQKVSYVLDLSARVEDGRLDLHGLRSLPDDDVLAAITAVKGFGRWSAEMFLMFQLNRADIFPVGDLGIVKGVQKLLGMKGRPAAATMLRTAELWRPYRSVAAWYLWRLIEPAPVAVRSTKVARPVTKVNRSARPAV
jgi:DNA-3-methyladenine glycosylase II